MEHKRVAYLQFSEEEQREIVFKDITTGQVDHTTILDTAGIADYQSVIGYFTQTIMRDLRLVSGYDVLYGKIKSFVQTELFDRPVDLEDPNTLRNLSELAATKTLIETFKKAINALTVKTKEMPKFGTLSSCANSSLCGERPGLSRPEKERFQPHHWR